MTVMPAPWEISRAVESCLIVDAKTGVSTIC